MNDIVECTDPRGREYFWIGPPEHHQDLKTDDTDIHHIHEKKITITPLSLNLTDTPTLKTLEEIFEA